MSSTRATGWLDDAVAQFGATCKDKLAGPGDREATIRSPLEALLGAAGDALGVPAVFHDEVRDTVRQVRPDYGVSVKGAITGYVEVKAPGKGIDPATFTGHDRTQWQRQRDLPNLLYTNGTDWRLYRDGSPVGTPVRFDGDLGSAGAALTAPAEFETILTNFLRWEPAPITSVGALVRAIAPLTRLLRGEVLDQLAVEQRAVAAGGDEWDQPFTGLARDWRALLFPQADDATFADGYAQAVTFALLLARTEGIDLTDAALHEVGARLGNEHSLMGKALQLLTDDVARDFKVTLDLLVRVVGAVDWPRVRKGKRDTYLHLYEDFLEQYDNDLRKQSGSYYTPREVVEHMVRLTEEALVTRLGKADGFRDPDVLTVDPAMGTGTYLHTILERVADDVAASDGPGAVAGVLGQVAERLVGFELQMGPYAVAELRTTDLLATHGASAPPGGMHLYVTDTLDDPHAAESQIGSGLHLIAQSRKKANEVKAKADVTVVIGNPPYKELAVGDGGWVESGSKAHGKTARAILEDFYEPGAGRFKAKLKNLYVYFWRWATWKVWESTPSDADGDAGVVCFISTSGYLTGPGFTGMRRYLREHASEGWIIDLTPEGQTPDVPTRIFPGVRQPLAIGLFIRRQDTDLTLPAAIRYRSLTGRQADKFAALGEVSLDGDGWLDARTDWTAPLTPSATSGWDEHPAVSDLFPWYSPGVFPTRGWVYGPSASVLVDRWVRLLTELDATRRSALFKEGRDANLSKGRAPLAGADTHRTTTLPLADDRTTPAKPIRVGYRSFDRQWVLPDPRVMDMPRRDLWEARVPGQVFVSELHTETIARGPGLTFTALIPDFHAFKGSGGGRTLPFLHPDGTPNLAPGLVAALAAALEHPVTAADVLTYVAGVVGHPAFTRTFADELTTPGIRVPLTTDPGLWSEAVALGEQVLWLHTYGERFAGPDRPAGSVRFARGDARQPLSRTAITGLPATMTYDLARGVVVVGTGELGPVVPEVWDYAVGGKNVLKSWFNYRKAEPGGKKTSPLDHVHVDAWDPDWTTELIDLLTVLTRLVGLEPAQADLLERVVAGPVHTLDGLRAAGVRWPTTAADRRPHRGLGTQDPAGNQQAALDL
ncbi:type ISP restriction/modification enzyme [Cellulomonas fimi]|uniref:site-specific DNA-methyltransferase (adenine-specific) n=1 Tax=Cellulomonas fimi TaxID=1708 RepID=A0A7Y0LVI5_CELFI|nr:type ISP restriction/modification enzyme [Cellulomonas fimi]NMR19002.1 N-6 DNA methylase [Cellulomonas fimi]